MYNRRPHTTGVAFREITDDCVVRNLFGETTFAKQFCPACNKVKNKFEFYVESTSKRKYKNQTRKQCVECWDIYKGSTKYNDSYFKILKIVKGR